jgi:predicted enzyme related to lactoylglutathione lyase
MPGDMGGTWTMLRLETGDFAGLYEMPTEIESLPPHWMPHIWIDDLDDAAAMAESLGGKATNGPLEILGAGRKALIQDTHGGHGGAVQGHGLRWCSAAPSSTRCLWLE